MPTRKYLGPVGRVPAREEGTYRRLLPFRFPSPCPAAALLPYYPTLQPQLLPARPWSRPRWVPSGAGR